MQRGAGYVSRRNATVGLRCIIVLLVLSSVAIGGVAGQTAPPNSYYGAAVTEDGTELPSGTTIIAVANGEIKDRITVDPPGEYGGSGATDDKLRVSSDVDSTVKFYVEKDDGTRIQADETDPDPTAEVDRFDLTFPVGTINPKPNFDVSNIGLSDRDVVEGAVVDVSATVTNTGTEDGTQIISLNIDDNTVRTTEITLAKDEQRTVQFSDVGTDGLGAGDHVIGVSSTDDRARTTLTVEAQRTNFTVSGLDPTDETVVVGTTVDFSATVTNDGNVKGTQTVSLRVDERALEQQDVTLAPGEQQQVVFEVNTSRVGTGTYTHSITTANDSQEGTLTINEEPLEPANFQVSNLNPTDVTVTEGDTFDASATVTNEGEERATQSVAVRIDGDVVQSQDVTLEGSEKTTVQFSNIDTNSVSPGSHSFSVRTDDDSQSGSLTVNDRPAPAFQVTSIDPTSATVTSGEGITVTATIENTGTAAGTQQVALRVDGDAFASQSVSLDAGEQTTVDFAAIETADRSSGTHIHRAVTNNGSRSGSFTIERESTPTQTVTATVTPTATVTETTTSSVTATTTPTTTGTANTPTPGTTDATATQATPTPTLRANGTATPTSDGGGLLPSGLLGTLITYIGIPLAVIYLILKAMAIYLGY